MVLVVQPLLLSLPLLVNEFLLMGRPCEHVNVSHALRLQRHTPITPPHTHTHMVRSA